MFVQRTARRLPSRRLRRSNRVAFTLLEVLLVMAILVVLASLAVGVFGGAQDTTNKKAASTDVKTIAAEAKRYKFDTGSWPNTLNDLKHNESNVANWAGPYMEKDNFNDPWGNEYIIVGPDQYDSALIIKSLGKPGSNEEIFSAQQ
jgi:general secretion pathway protein G